MNPFFWLPRGKKLVYLLLAAALFSIASLWVMSLTSTGHKAAVNAVFAAPEVEQEIGQVSSALLTGAASKYSGAAGCADFRYLVFGQKGVRFFSVRVEYRARKDPWKLIALSKGLGSDFPACWQNNEPDVSSASPR